MKVTIKDIAKRAGVSPTTVSLVLNKNTKSVSDATAENIKKIAKELNYQPNISAISLVTKKSKTIGLIIPNIGNPFFAEMALAIEEYVSKEGYNLILCNTNENFQKDIRYINLLHARGVDGILIAISPTKDNDEENEIINAINDLDIPVVAIDRWLTDMNCKRVTIDHRKGAYIATHHLISLGHKSIATITGPLTVYTGKTRLTGYREALDENKIPYQEDLVYHGDYSFESGYLGGLEVLKNHPTAVFAANDMMAFGLLKAAREMKIKVPDDLSVVGFDNLLMSSLIDIPLTTITQPVNELGKTVCEMLFDKINKENKINEDITLEPCIEIRSSTSKNKRS